MRKKVLLLVLLAVGIVANLSAGGSNESSSQKGEEPIKQISMMWWGNETRHAATNAAVDVFREDNPKIKVTTMPNPFDGYHDKIIIQLSNGTAPDLFCFSTEWIAEVGYASKPILLDLNQVSDIIDFSTFSPSLIGGGEVNGKLIGLPTGISGWNFVYNKRIIDQFLEETNEKLPLPPDETWSIEDMMAFAKKVKKALGDDVALLGTNKDNITHFFVYALSEVAGKFYISNDCRLQFNEEDLEQTLVLMKELTDAGVFPSGNLQVESFSGSSIYNTYVTNGKWLGYFDWTSNIPEFESLTQSKGANYPYPTIGRTENDGLFVRPAQFWSISATSKNTREAAKLLNFIVNDAKAITCLKLERSVPPTENGQKVLAEEGILKGTTYDATSYLMKEADSSYTPFILIPELLEVLRTEYSKFITGQISAHDAAGKLMPQFEAITQAMRQRNNIQ